MRRALLVLFMALNLGAAPVWAQMDMLPFLFRDLPQEFEEGLPPSMTYEEFRQLNRKVDFFTVGMSMIWPGYASAQVERSDQALLLGGTRWATYALMGVALVRQWDDLESVGSTGNLEPLRYDRVKTNVAFFATGAVLNMFLWGADVLLAYHEAMEDRDAVIYRYGLVRSLDSAGLPDEERLRRMASQDDPKVRQRIIPELTQRLAAWETPGTFGEFSWYLGNHLSVAGDQARAVATLLRGMVTDPDSPWHIRTHSLLLEILDTNKAVWKGDAVRIEGLLDTPSPDPLSYLQLLPELESRDLREAFLELADQYLERPGLPANGDKVLAQMASAWNNEGNKTQEALALQKLASFYPHSPLLSSPP